MLKYKKLTDLTDEEIKFAINDIIHPKSIGEIKRDYRWDIIDVDVTTDWGEPDKEDLITDTITLHYDKLSVPWYDYGNANYKWRQFLLAKGCNGLLKDNPYLEVG